MERGEIRATVESFSIILSAPSEGDVQTNNQIESVSLPQVAERVSDAKEISASDVNKLLGRAAPIKQEAVDEKNFFQRG